jgi:predicted nucleotide-binding protein
MKGTKKTLSNIDVKTKKSISRVSQSDVPGNKLTNALRIPMAIAENYANGPVTALQLAQALNMTPTSGRFRMLTGSSVAYGLTDGAYNAKEITLTNLGKRVIRPLIEGDDIAAKREALLKPRIINEFLSKYNESPLPREEIALNVIEQMGVPRERAKDTFNMIIESAENLGLITVIKGKKYVSLSRPSSPVINEDCDENDVDIDSSDTQSNTAEILNFSSNNGGRTEILDHVVDTRQKNKKVFITHGKNRALIETLKKLLKYGELEAVISVEKESVSKPLPEKLMKDMRECGAAVIHVDAEQKFLNEEGEEVVVLNPNVLIEIGAAMALYGKRFILLVQDGVKLPSNLQGLYEVRYTGNDLGSDGTLKLLDAINEMKSEPTPTSI